MYCAGGSARGGYAYENTSGGAGPGATGAYSETAGSNGNAYPGGGLWIFVGGKVNITANGKITADGQNGTGTSQNAGSGGGGGGGIVALIYNADYLNEGSVRANGGKGGSGNAPGKDGAIGTVLIQKISELMG